MENTANQNPQTDAKELLSRNINLAGLPKHGTRWARAHCSHAGESLT
jgi:hypothetical protein